MTLKNNLKLAVLGMALLPALGLWAAPDYQQPREQVRHLTTLNEDLSTAVFKQRSFKSGSYQTQLVGFVYYAASWNNLPSGESTPLGLYTIDTSAGSQPEQFARIGKMNSLCNGGAVLAGDTYWWIWRQTDTSGAVDISQLYSYNIKTGAFVNHGTVSSDMAGISDKTYDPTNGTIYGQYSVDGTWKLCKIDYENQQIVPVGNCYSYYGLACDANGQLWGIDQSGDLYKVDKINGSATRIGSTGITPKYAQSMTFDQKTGTLWWASYSGSDDNAQSRLYTVDTQTGRATLVTTFDDEQEIIGLGVMPPLAADDAPGLATDLKLDIENNNTQGTLSFRLPEETYMGGNIDGEITYKAYANDALLFQGSGSKGETVSKEVTLSEGDCVVSVVCSNAEGDGPEATMQQWVGNDYPQAPDNVKLTIDESTGKASVTWDAVSEGQHGGYVDPAAVTYTVTRQPDNKVVAEKQSATTFTETLAEPNVPEMYSYEIKAYNGWRESKVAASNSVPYGKGFEVPYYNDFNDASSLDLFYIIDGNNDGKTWEWDSHKSKRAYIFTGTNKAGYQDDWLITPGIDMKAGNRYELTYYECATLNNGKFVDNMEVKFGQGVDPSTYTTAEENFESLGKEKKHTVTLEPAADGYYHIGFHATSSCKLGLSIAIDELSVDVLPNESAPAAPTSLSLKASQGTAPVTIKFKAPTQRVNGDNLDNISKIDVFRNTNELVKTIDAPTPGKAFTVTDNKGAKGMTYYTVVAYNEAGIGERAKDSVYLGLDLPGAPQNILLTDEGEGKIRLTWDKPKAGAHGGYCDVNNLTYNVYDLSRGYANLFQRNLRDLELNIAVDDYEADEQELVYFGLSAVNSAGEGGIYQSSEVVVGKPYSYPFQENWTDGEPKYEMWYRMSNGANGWQPETGNSSDGDNGSMAFQAAADGDLSYLCLGKVALGNAKKPKLLFDYYAVPGADIQLLPEINLAFTGEYDECQTIDFSTLKGEQGWRQCVVDLNGYQQDYSYICIRFLGRGVATTPLRIDNLRIMDSDETPDGIASVKSDADNASAIYDLSGRKVLNMQSDHVYLIRNAEGKVSKVVR